MNFSNLGGMATDMIDNLIDGKIVLLNKSEIVRVVRRALSKIDPRLIDHGERVGYIAVKICGESRDSSYFDFTRLFVLCALHDIGAYKTDEIDDMVRFETETVFDHSLYGYLFLKNTTHLSEYAEAVLYHHADYTAPELAGCRYAKYAELIHLADRIDILLGADASRLSVLHKLSGTKFAPEYVDAFFKADEKYGLSHKIMTGEYKQEAEEMVESLEIGNGEILDYLKLLVYAIDFRSPYTVTHTADTTVISLETGKLLGLPEKDLQALYIGAFLHDIGKIAIPHSILDKPGRLTPSEYEIVKRHIPEGEQILRGVVSNEICDIALRHHEKLDGSGYSRGLDARALTFSQRIVAVADIFSALSQRRSYKEAFPKERVVDILTGMRDAGQLCPRVVDIMCGNYELILGNTEKSHDPVKLMYKRLMQEYAEHSARMSRR